MGKQSSKTVSVETGTVHRFEVRSWIKVVLQSGTGMRVPDEFVIIHLPSGDPIDAYLDANGELEAEVPYGRVQVEFPGLFHVRHLESLRDEGSPGAEASERSVEVRKGAEVHIPRREELVAEEPEEAGEEEPEVLFFDLGAHEDSLEADDPSEGDLDPVDDHEDGHGDEPEDEQDEQDELESDPDAVEGLECCSPAFWVATHEVHRFELRGALEVRLSRAFFRDDDAVSYSLRDEDGELLIESSTRSQRLTFPALGVGTYALKVNETDFELASTQLRKFVQFLAPEEEDDAT
jgi:hypothetical protein